MTAVLIACAVLLSLVLLVLMYWTVLASFYPEELRTDEVYMVQTQDLWKIRVCRYRKGRSAGEPVLLVHGANANHHNFTLPKDGCLIDYLTVRGYDCWAVDLRGCRSSSAPFERKRTDATIDDYLQFDLPAVIEFIQSNTGHKKVHWIGHSMGGMLLYAYALKHGTAAIQSGVTLGSPLGFKDATVRVSSLLIRIVHVVPGLCGNIIRGYIPIKMIIGGTSKAFPINLKNLHPDIHSGHLYAMIDDPLPNVLGQLSRWLETKTWKMLGGSLDVGGHLTEIDAPLLAFYAQEDPFVTPAGGKAFIDGLQGKDKKIVVCSRDNGCVRDYGHCDLAFGREGGREVFKPIFEWLQAHAITTPKQFGKVGEKSQEGISARISDNDRAGILAGKNAESKASAVKKTVTKKKSTTKEKVASPKKKATPKKKAATKAKAKPKAAPKKKAATKAKAKPKAAPKKKAAIKAKAKAKAAPKKKTAAQPQTPAKKKSSKVKLKSAVTERSAKSPSAKTKAAIRNASKELKALLDD